MLVYSRDAADLGKQAQAAWWMDYLWRTHEGRLSAQVLSEFYVTVTRKLDPGMTVPDARADIRDLMAWQPVPVDSALVAAAWAIEDMSQLSYWDALIVAAAEQQDCAGLLTEDLQDGRELGGLRVISPFRHEPPE